MTGASALIDEYPDEVLWAQPEGVEARLPWTMRTFEEEYDALRQHAALFDLSYLTTVELTGNDAADLLQYACARDVSYLLPEKVLISAVLGPSGQVRDVVLIRKSDAGFLLESSIGCGSALLGHLVEVGGRLEDLVVLREEALLGVEGPFAWKCIAEVLGPLAGSLPFQASCSVSWKGCDVQVVRCGSTAEYGFRVRASDTISAELWRTISKLAVPAGYRALELAQLEARHPTPHRECSAGESVTECGFNWLVEPFKPDYCGRDAMQEACIQGRQARTIGVSWKENESVPPGARVVVGGMHEIGSIIWSEFSPGRQEMIGLARVDAQWAAAGLACQVENEGGLAEAQTEAAPYVVPRSWSTPIS